MSAYLPPHESYTQYNPDNFPAPPPDMSDLDDVLIKKAGDTASGVITFNQGIVSNAPMTTADGSTANPIYTFTNALTTGLYSKGASQIGFSVGGDDVLSTTADEVVFHKPIEPPTTATQDIGMSNKRVRNACASTGAHLRITNHDGDTMMRFAISRIDIDVPFYLPTVDGTASSLNYYEIFTHTTTWSGIWATPISLGGGKNPSVVRLNDVVWFTAEAMASVLATTSSFVTMDTALPERVRPSQIRIASVMLRENGPAYRRGFATVGTDGVLRIYMATNVTVPYGNYNGLSTGSSGWLHLCFSYIM